MSVDELRSRPAVSADTDTILALMQAFYAEEHLVFDEPAARRAVGELLRRPEQGTLLLFESAGRVVGHAALTFGFSLEFHGRFVLLDELFLVPDVRGRGWGHRALALVETWARPTPATALRLELNRGNTQARSLYTAAGFSDDHRDLLTKRLSTSEPATA